jgi:predicted nuclease with TOPRIM domain
MQFEPNRFLNNLVINALNTFLTQERAVSELRQVRSLAKQTQTRVQDEIARRIPLLDQTVNELEQRVQSVEPEFNKLSQIRDQFQDEIRNVRDRSCYRFGLVFRRTHRCRSLWRSFLYPEQSFRSS